MLLGSIWNIFKIRMNLHKWDFSFSDLLIIIGWIVEIARQLSQTRSIDNNGLMVKEVSHRMSLFCLFIFHLFVNERSFYPSALENECDTAETTNLQLCDKLSTHNFVSDHFELLHEVLNNLHETWSYPAALKCKFDNSFIASWKSWYEQFMNRKKGKLSLHFFLCFLFFRLLVYAVAWGATILFRAILKLILGTILKMVRMT